MPVIAMYFGVGAVAAVVSNLFLGYMNNSLFNHDASYDREMGNLETRGRARFEENREPIVRALRRVVGQGAAPSAAVSSDGAAPSNAADENRGRRRP